MAAGTKYERYSALGAPRDHSRKTALRAQPLPSAPFTQGAFIVLQGIAVPNIVVGKQTCGEDDKVLRFNKVQ